MDRSASQYVKSTVKVFLYQLNQSPTQQRVPSSSLRECDGRGLNIRWSAWKPTAALFFMPSNQFSSHGLIKDLNCGRLQHRHWINTGSQWAVSDTRSLLMPVSKPSVRTRTRIVVCSEWACFYLLKRLCVPSFKPLSDVSFAILCGCHPMFIAFFIQACSSNSIPNHSA